MLGFITENVYKPWSSSDIKKYETEGSQRDEVIYNSFYDARIMLSEENLFQCSMRVKANLYKNYYLMAVRRNMFYFIIYVPQLDIVKNLLSYEFVSKCVKHLPTINKFINHTDSSLDINKVVSFCDRNCVVMRVDAPIGEFLFPKRGYITNDEIVKKYSAINAIYSRANSEFECLANAASKYSDNINAQIQKQEEQFKKKLLRKGIRVGISAVLACTTGIYVDLDTIFGFEDVADAADILDLADSADLVDASDYGLSNFSEWDSPNDILTSGNDISFGSRMTLDDRIANINHVYDPDIDRAYDRLSSDYERIIERGDVYSWEDSKHVLQSDINRVDYWEQNKAEAIAQAKVEQSQQDYWDAVSAYCKESMGKKIHGK